MSEIRISKNKRVEKIIESVEIKNGTNYTLTDDILNYDGLEKNIYISDYTNKKDKNYKTFKKCYDKFLSKYFRDFLVV